MNNFSSEKIKLLLAETINEAELALNEGNYPIGALIANKKGDIVAKSRNKNFTNNDISAHAEILCLREMGTEVLSKDNGKKHFLFTSLEPCGGCGFFIARTNVKVIYAAAIDPYKPGVSVLKKSKEFGGMFEKVEFIVGEFKDLAIKSRRLMRDYLLSRGNEKAAKAYE